MIIDCNYGIVPAERVEKPQRREPAVYVCICNNLKESDFQEIARKHPEATAEDAYRLLGHEPDCGTCKFFAADVMNKARLHLTDPKPPSFATAV